VASATREALADAMWRDMPGRYAKSKLRLGRAARNRTNGEGIDIDVRDKATESGTDAAMECISCAG
jgi:hypothetical protein